MAKKKIKPYTKKALGVRGGFATSATGRALSSAGSTFVRKTAAGRAAGKTWGRSMLDASSHLGKLAAAKATTEGQQWLAEQAGKQADKLFDRIVTSTGDILENVKLPNKPGTSMVMNFPALTSETVKKSPVLLAKNNSKVYTTKFTYGKPTSKSVRRAMLQGGKTKLLLEDTRRSKAFMSTDSFGDRSSILGNKSREKFTITAGFNQRTYSTSSFMNGVSFGNILSTYNIPLDVNNLENDPKSRVPNNDQFGRVAEYAVAANSRNKISITSLNSYNQTHVRVSLISKREVDFSGKRPTDWHVPLQFFVPASEGSQRTVPYGTRANYPTNLISHQNSEIQHVPNQRVFKYTHETPAYDGQPETTYNTSLMYSGWNGFMQTTSSQLARVQEFAQCIVDPTVTWRNSPVFNRSYTVVKTFNKKLMPGDTWHVDLLHQLGSGIDLTSVTSAVAQARRLVDSGNLYPNISTPLGYYVVIDIVGQPTVGFMKGAASGPETGAAADTTIKSEPIHGTSPCAVQVDVTSSIEVGTLSNNKVLGTNPSSTKYATRIFQNLDPVENSQLVAMYNTDYGSNQTEIYAQTNTDTQPVQSIGGVLNNVVP